MILRRGESPIGISKVLAPGDSKAKRVLFIFGTRPEAIKLCPLISALRASDASIQVVVCVTGQHREMLHQVLEAFEIESDFDLDVMTQAQTLNGLSSLLLAGLENVFDQVSPDLTIVQGDTTTTLCGALASFHRQVPVAHVEAGLRTYDLSSPFPEESNRVLTDRLSLFHFAATSWAADNLLREGFPVQGVTITGNTGIDAVLIVQRSLDNGKLQPRTFMIDASKRLILVTAHRRESFGAAFAEICSAVASLSERKDIQVIWPVHPNPHVKMNVERAMQGRSNVLLTGPLDYVTFVHLMRSCYVIMTDSGGIQEEANALGKPVLVMREKTERPEVLQCGTGRLAGTDRASILTEANQLLDNPDVYARMARAGSEYGDGQASLKIAKRITEFLFPRLTN